MRIYKPSYIYVKRYNLCYYSHARGRGFEPRQPHQNESRHFVTAFCLSKNPRGAYKNSRAVNGMEKPGFARLFHINQSKGCALCAYFSLLGKSGGSGTGRSKVVSGSQKTCSCADFKMHSITSRECSAMSPEARGARWLCIA